MAKRLYIITVILGFYSHHIFPQEQFFSWEGSIKDEIGKRIEYAHIQLNSEHRHYLFMSNEAGDVKIQYSNPKYSDSLIISCIGYTTLQMAISELKEKNYIVIKEASYQINEVTIKPGKCKLITLGNKKNIPIGSSQVSFNAQNALFVQNQYINGKIVSINIYMHNGHKEKNWEHRPFRLQLYDGHPIGGKKLINNEIIVSLPANEKNWVTINLSDFNISMPTNGVTISVEALSKDFYLNNGYIDTVITESGIINSIAVGWTFDGIRGSKGIESWRYSEYNGWHQRNSKNNFLYKINIEVCEE